MSIREAGRTWPSANMLPPDSDYSSTSTTSPTRLTHEARKAAGRKSPTASIRGSGHEAEEATALQSSSRILVRDLFNGGPFNCDDMPPDDPLRRDRGPSAAP